MATTVKITETYDLKTTTNKVGVIGVHTPSKALIKKLYPGLCKNHRFLRLDKCDVTGVCASVLPADPLQVGVEAGDVAPEDMFNPILYKPVSNESLDAIASRIYTVNSTIPGAGSLDSTDITVDPWEIYYSLLSESKRWKKAMPQNGFALRGLYPICYQMINTFGNVGPIGRFAHELPASAESSEVSATDDTSVTYPYGTYNDTTATNSAVSFRGKSVKMPRFPLHQDTELGFDPDTNLVTIGDFKIPKTYVACFIIPPARLHEFYYRMRVSWTMTFSGVCSTVETNKTASDYLVAQDVYAKNFSYGSKDVREMDNDADLVDTNDVSITPVMVS